MMKYRILIAAIPIVLLYSALISACSTQDWYNGTRSAQELSCLKQPEAEYNDCMKGAGKSYNRYKKDRDQLNKPSPDIFPANTPLSH